ISVNAAGDGLDSNGDLYIYGGTIYVDGPENSGNGALDKGDQGVAVISGGTIIATGMSGMAETFSEDSTQASIMLNLESTVTGEVQLLDSEGNLLCSYTPTKTYNSIVVSTAGLTEGETYTIVAGDTSTEITVESMVTTEGTQTMGGMGGGMPGGNFSQDGSSDSQMTAPSGNMPSGGPSGNMPSGDASEDSGADSSTDTSEDTSTSETTL
nr:hypothetical protein [Lachnospiraceae bacterium]